MSSSLVECKLDERPIDRNGSGGKSLLSGVDVVFASLQIYVPSIRNRDLVRFAGQIDRVDVRWLKKYTISNDKSNISNGR